MKVVLIGPQGSGKGTQAAMLSKKFNIPHIGTGDMLRNAPADVKKRIKKYIIKGELVPDELMLFILQERLQWDDCKNGFVLDSYPRDIKQAKDLKGLAEIDKVIELQISDKESTNRVLARMSCYKCGSTFNTITKPAHKKGVCDVCGSALYKRVDDNLETAQHRLEVYHKVTEPLIKFYPAHKVIHIDGEQPIKKVSQDILKTLEAKD